MKNDWIREKKEAERDWLIEKHKPMVLHLAKKISQSLPFSPDFEDLVAYGQLGLVEASERFDATRGNSFGTFAFYRIKGAIYDGLREMGAISRSRSFRFAANANDLLMTEVDDTTYNAGAATVDDEVKSVEKLVDSLIPIYFLSLDAEGAMEVRDESAFTPETGEAVVQVSAYGDERRLPLRVPGRAGVTMEMRAMGLG